jgi:hypothetical protein
MLTNNYGVPQQIVAAVSRKTYKKTADISATGLILPPRGYQLKQRHEDEIIEDVSDRIWAYFGTIAHLFLEAQDDSGAFHEENLTITVHGWTVSCRTDAYCTKQLAGYHKDGSPIYTDILPTIRDYKNIAVGAHSFPHPEWDQQLNINAVIWRAHGFPVEDLEIIMLFRDWRKMQAENPRGIHRQSWSRKSNYGLQMRQKCLSAKELWHIKRQRPCLTICFLSALLKSNGGSLPSGL